MRRGESAFTFPSESVGSPAVFTDSVGVQTTTGACHFDPCFPRVSEPEWQPISNLSLARTRGYFPLAGNSRWQVDLLMEPEGIGPSALRLQTAQEFCQNRPHRLQGQRFNREFGWFAGLLLCSAFENYNTHVM